MANKFNRLLSNKIGTVTRTLGADEAGVGAYVVPPGTTTTVIGLSLANLYDVEIKVDVILTNGAANYYINKNSILPPGDTLVVVGGDQKIVLLAGDSIKVRSDTITSLDAVMSILELT